MLVWERRKHEGNNDHRFVLSIGDWSHGALKYGLEGVTIASIYSRDASIKEALAEEERLAAKFVNQIEVAKSKRDFELKKATYDQEVHTKKADAELSYSLQAAKTRQRIKEEQMQVRVVERTQAIQVAEQEILRKEKELEATIRRPAEAEKYRLEKLAEANKNRVVLEAEAEAEAVR